MRAARGREIQMKAQSLKWAKKWAHPDQDRAEWGWQWQAGREAEVGAAVGGELLGLTQGAAGSRVSSPT